MPGSAASLGRPASPRNCESFPSHQQLGMWLSVSQAVMANPSVGPSWNYQADRSALFTRAHKDSLSVHFLQGKGGFFEVLHKQQSTQFP